MIPEVIATEGFQHVFVSLDGLHCIHCFGYPYDVLHWCGS